MNKLFWRKKKLCLMFKDWLSCVCKCMCKNFRFRLHNQNLWPQVYRHEIPSHTYSASPSMSIIMFPILCWKLLFKLMSSTFPGHCHCTMNGWINIFNNFLQNYDIYSTASCWSEPAFLVNLVLLSSLKKFLWTFRYLNTTYAMSSTPYLVA